MLTQPEVTLEVTKTLAKLQTIGTHVNGLNHKSPIILQTDNFKNSKNTWNYLGVVSVHKYTYHEDTVYAILSELMHKLGIQSFDNLIVNENVILFNLILDI